MDLYIIQLFTTTLSTHKVKTNFMDYQIFNITLIWFDLSYALLKKIFPQNSSIRYFPMLMSFLEFVQGPNPKIGCFCLFLPLRKI